jgi:hypothetical protein
MNIVSFITYGVIKNVRITIFPWVKHTEDLKKPDYLHLIRAFFLSYYYYYYYYYYY